MLALAGGSPASGQYFPLADGYRLADSLYANHLLSPAGRDRLKQGLADGRLPVYGPTRSAFPEYGDTVSAGQLLGYLYRAYQDAYVYRTGILVEGEVLRERGIADLRTLTDDQRLEVAKEVQRRLAAIPGRQTELNAAAALPPGQAHPRSPGLIRYELANSPSDERIPVDRSSFGYAVDTTLRVIGRLGLIPDAALQEELEELRRSGRLPDYLPLQALAQSVGEQEITRLRMGKRAEAVRWLVGHDLLNASLADGLVADTSFLQSDSRQDLYAFPGPQFSVSLSATDSLDALFEQLTRQLCAHDPRFCGTIVTAVPVTTDGSGSRTKLVGKEEGKAFYTGPDLFIPPPRAPFSDWSGTYMLEQLTAPYNALLRRENADYRLYFLPLPDQTDAGTLVLRTFPLTSLRARALVDPVVSEVAGGLQGPSSQGFLSPSEAVEIRDSLQEMGLFRSLSSEQWTAGKGCTESRALDGLLDFFACFPALYLPASDAGATAVLKAPNPLSALPGEYYLFLPTSAEQLPVYLKLEGRAAEFLERRSPGSWLRAD